MFWRHYNSFMISLGMFTRLPAPIGDFSKGTSGIMAAFPFVGALIGGLWWAVAVACRAFAPPLLGGSIVAVFPFLITGFIHLDGFMDVSDAVMSRRPLADRLRILKDPHTGAFAVCCLAMLMLLFAPSCYEVLKGEHLAMLLFVPIISRCFSALAVLSLKPLPTSSLAAGFNRDANRWELAVVISTLVVSAAVMVFLCGVASLAVLAVMAVTQLLATMFFTKQFGGFSGDGAGYMLTLGELSAVISLALWR